MNLSRRIIVAALLSFTALVSAEAQTSTAQRFWTTVGSAGTVDEADAGKIVLDHATAQFGQPLIIASTAAAAPGTLAGQTASAVIRYNVTPVPSLFTPGMGALQLRYLATGPGGRTVAKLIEVDLASGVERTRVILDSSTAPADRGYHVGGAENCKPGGSGFDFATKAYYVEVTLTHSSVITGGAAGVQIIKIVRNVCLT